MLISLVFTAPVSAYKPSTFTLTAEGCLIANVDTDAVIYEKNADERIHPASTTKIMTLIVALENCKDMDASVTVRDTFDDDLIMGSTSISLK